MKIKDIALIFLFVGIILTSGCVGQRGGVIEEGYSDDGFTERRTVVTSTYLYPLETTSIDFVLDSTLPNEVWEMSIKIDPGPFNIMKVECPTGDTTDIGCYFDTVQSLDIVGGLATLRAPDKTKIGNIEIEFNPKIYVEYDYYGESTTTFPVLSSEEFVTQIMGDIEERAKTRSSQTRGPIKASIEPDFFKEAETEKGRMVVKDWIVENQPFVIEVEAENVARVGSDIVYPTIKIPPEDFKLYLYRVELDEESVCHFKEIGEEGGETILVPKDPVEIPMRYPLRCGLKSEDTEGIPKVTGRIRAEYYYTYEFVKELTITVAPSPV